ncbi:nuclear transport factor 2 family protein [soil metagenome]
MSRALLSFLVEEGRRYGRRVAEPVDALQRLVAHDEIRLLASRYAVAVDSRDLHALVALFVDDVRVGRGTTGHAALRASFEASLGAVGVTILQVGTHAIDLQDADHATGTVYCTGEVADGDRWIRQAIAYRDSYRRTAGGWRFVRRVHELWYGQAIDPNPLDQAPADWPERPDGRGTLPESWPTWSAFWSPEEGPDDGPVTTGG